MVESQATCEAIEREKVLLGYLVRNGFNATIKVVSNSLRIQYFTIDPSISTFGITIYEIVHRDKSCYWNIFLQRNKMQTF